MNRIRRLKAAALIVGLVLLLGQAALAATVAVTRGPYLQTGTPTSIVVKWRTDVQTDSCVRYGTPVSNLTSTTCQTTATTDHEVELGGLWPNTKYYYSIGTTEGSLAGGKSSYFFFTAPRTGTSKPTRIWVIGDSGTASSRARAVRNAYLPFIRTRHTDLWLMLGDNAYPDGTDSQYQAAVFDMYPTVLRNTVLWPTLGNHDVHSADSSSQSGPYYDIFTLPKSGEAGGLASGTEAYYSFNYGNIHFVCLDSTGSNRSPSGAMLTWLKADLAATKQDWIIAYWHHPPYSKGSHDSDTDIQLRQMRQYALPILESYGVDLVLSGHSHSYERSYLLDGHYGTSDTLTSLMILDSGDGREDGNGAYEKPLGFAPHRGAVYTVAGNSGATEIGPLNHPAMYLSLDVLGSLVLDIDGNRLDAQFLNSTGVIQDHFTIKKDPVTVSFQDGVSPTSSYNGTRDNRLSQPAPDQNFGEEPTLWVEGDNGSLALLRWKSFTIPAGSTVKSATITLNVTDPTTGTYNLYALKRDWWEDYSNWNSYGPGHSWEIPGAKGTSDRGTAVLGTITAPSTGAYTITLNAAGIALVQSWVDDPRKNHGIIIDNPIVSDGMAFDSRGVPTASNHPKLTITYAPW